MTTRRKSAAAEVHPVTRNTYVPGCTGRPTIRVCDTIAEVNYGTAEAPDSISFPTGGAHAGEPIWAVVQIAMADRSEWSIGIGGWVPDRFPTMEAAVAAACDPKTRKALLAGQRWQRELGELEARLREHYEAMPEAPAGACERWPTRTVYPPR